jgi:hypothetical protein
MTAFTRTPQGTGLLQPSKFILTFDRIKTVQYYCQSVNIPGVNLGQAPINLPSGDIYAPGNKITYNPLNIHFLIDSRLEGWQELHSWYRSIASPESFQERKTLTAMQNQYAMNKKNNYSDATLTVLSSMNNPILRVQFTNCFPITLSDVIFDSAQSADDTISADGNFVFDYFNFLPIE